MPVEIVESLDDLKEYIDTCRVIRYRVLSNEIRIRAGGVGAIIKFDNPKEKEKIISWLNSLKETKRVIKIVDVVPDDEFFT